MSLLLALIIGVLVGTAGGFLLQRNFDLLLMNVLMGIVGSILGGAVYLLGVGEAYLLFSWGGALSSLVGALLVVLLFDLLNRAAPEKVNPEDPQE